MKGIILNESHIRQLVKETLENLILGEDDMEINDEYIEPSPEEVKNMILNTNLIVDGCSVEGNNGRLDLWDGKDCEITIVIEFGISAHVNPYYPGNYWTPPEGGDLEIDNIKMYNYEIYYGGDRIEGVGDEELDKYVENLLDQHFETIYDKVDPDYFDDESWGM